MLFIKINYHKAEALCETHGFQHDSSKIIENLMLFIKITYQKAEALCEMYGFTHHS